MLAARILAEARASFAEHGYSGTTVRAVARAADVDPALVYHYYGSKENLLDVATTPPQSFLDQIVIAWQTPPAELGEQLVRQMLQNWQNPEHEPILRAVMQIAGNEPAIREKLRRIIQRSMMGPSAQALVEDERALRSSLIASQLMGLAFMRFVWKIEPLASLDDDAVVAAIAPTSSATSTVFSTHRRAKYLRLTRRNWSGSFVRQWGLCGLSGRRNDQGFSRGA